jgi:hypothetical protein
MRLVRLLIKNIHVYMYETDIKPNPSKIIYFN